MADRRGQQRPSVEAAEPPGVGGGGERKRDATPQGSRRRFFFSAGDRGKERLRWIGRDGCDGFTVEQSMNSG